MAEYSQQWSTLFALLTSDSPIDPRVVELQIRSALPNWEFEPFVTYASTYTSVDGVAKTGPWVGRLNMPGSHVLAIKANARTKNREAAMSETGVSMDVLRKVVFPKLKEQGVFNSYASIYPYGVISTFTKEVDKGLPQTPALPPEPEVATSWVMLLLLMVAGVALVVERKGAVPALAGYHRSGVNKNFGIYRKKDGELVEGGFFSKAAAEDYLYKSVENTRDVLGLDYSGRYVVKRQK